MTHHRGSQIGFSLPVESWNWDQCWDDRRNHSATSCHRQP